ncbi:hypothetical protein [Rubrobacter indicoceani]|uniref:hypothetical protein n=1 Tax=Rubrobacter indicoceani TaxID=2051957 RepID=UPI000E5C4941|nr:hypothetical protein [Rubrobacter indicoceani]
MHRNGLNLTHDYHHPLSEAARCRIRVYLSDDDRDAPVVILTEPTPNPASPVLDGADRLAEEICDERSPEFSGRPAPVFIQHNEERDGFYLLVLTPAKFTGPRWKHLGKRTVEGLIGGNL